MTRGEKERRIKERLEAMGLSCDGAAPLRLAVYHELLSDWNTRMNLTGDTDFDTVLDRHFSDSLTPLTLHGLFPQGAKLVDVGSGAGFPGLPLAIARPDLSVTLMDSLAKRIRFLDAVTEELGLCNVQTLHRRAEDGGQEATLREAFDLAVARAVAPTAVLCELLLPLVKAGGKMVCYKGPAAKEEAEAANRAAALLGGKPVEILPVAMAFQPDWQHALVICEKMQKTVRQYPRKAGIPSRIPLGQSDKG